MTVGATARLAARHAAPVVLTPSKRLHAGVADYIDDHQVSSVVDVGTPEFAGDERFLAELLNGCIDESLNPPKTLLGTSSRATLPRNNLPAPRAG